jgi:hypothetical protein
VRRKKFNDRITNFVQSFQTQIQSELNQESIKRRAFNELNGNIIYLKPLSLLINKPSPNININFSSEDINLPDLGDITTVEDEFCFIEQGTTEEKLKRVEREKGELSEILSTVTKELSVAKQTIDHQPNKFLLYPNNFLIQKRRQPNPMKKKPILILSKRTMQI